MITIITTFVRPNTSIKFFAEAFPVIAEKISELYRSTRSVDSVSSAISSDGLTLRVVITHVDQAHRSDFMAELANTEPNYFAARDQYCAANGITITKTVS